MTVLIDQKQFSKILSQVKSNDMSWPVVSMSDLIILILDMHRKLFFLNFLKMRERDSVRACVRACVRVCVYVCLY